MAISPDPGGSSVPDALLPEQLHLVRGNHEVDVAVAERRRNVDRERDVGDVRRRDRDATVGQERDRALEQLERLAGVPTGPSYGDLRLGPMWDPLRGDPRFEKIVSSLAPKE